MSEHENDRFKWLTPDPGPCPACGTALDPVAVGRWIAGLSGDDPEFIAVRHALELRDDRMAMREASYDVCEALLERQKARSRQSLPVRIKPAIEYGRNYSGTGAWLDRDGTVRGGGMNVTNLPRNDGPAVLDDLAAWIGQYIAFPTPHAITAVTLWAAHTWAADRFYVTPRILFDSAEPGSGKTRALELLSKVSSTPKLTISTTTAALYRRIAASDSPLTVLMDEVDALFGKNATPQAEDLRALINSGYKRGATVDRCVGDGKSIKVEEFPVFAPIALAGLSGRVPATITSRSVVIHMRRRAPGEHVKPFRERDAEDEVKHLRARLIRWVDSCAEALEKARPVMPAGVVDRPSEVWEALLAVADAAGGDWPDRARAACRHFVLNTDPDNVSFGVRLLGHIRDVFNTEGVDRIPSAVLVDRLVKLDESPYADLWGKALDQRRLAKELARYGVKSRNAKVLVGGTEKVNKTYFTDDECGLPDAWRRYLDSGATSATGATEQVNAGSGSSPVAHANATADSALPTLTREVAPVADVAEKSRWRVSGEEV